MHKIAKQNKNKHFKPVYCKKTISGNITEYMEMSQIPTPPPVRKLNKREYVNIRTGQVCEYSLSSSRSDNTDSLRKTFKKIRDVINANCEEPDHLHWVTLTYKENMTDSKQLYKDFDSFRKRFKRYCDKHSLCMPEYISVAEPQARGAWHLHLILIWNCKRPFIDNNTDFQPLWGHGFTKIQACPNADNLGAYLSAYLGDIPVSEYTGDVSKCSVKTVKGKKYIKGGRLSLYPVGMNIFRHSKNIKKPVSNVVDIVELEKEKVSSGKLTYRSVCSVTDEKTEKTILISKSYYNSKRERSQVEKILDKALKLDIEIECVETV